MLPTICEILRATFENPNFQSFCELRKSSKYSLRSTFKNPNFESKDKLGKYFDPNLTFTVESKGNLNKIILPKFQIYNNEWYIKLPQILGIYQWKWVGEYNSSIGKNGILNPFEIMHIQQNLWPLGNALLARLYLYLKKYITFTKNLIRSTHWLILY